MNRLFREPALLLSIVSAGLTLVGTLGLGLSPEAAALWSGAVAAAFGAVTAAVTRPVAPGAFLALVGAVTPVLSLYSLHLSTETIGALNVLVVALTTALFRGQVTPAYDSQPTPTVVL